MIIQQQPIELSKDIKDCRVEQIKRAIYYYTKAINLKPMITAYFNRAMAYFEIKELDNANSDLDKIIELKNKNSDELCFLEEIYYYKYLYFFLLKDFENALTWINKSINIKSNNGLLLKKADLLNILGEYDEAIKLYDIILEE